MFLAPEKSYSFSVVFYCDRELLMYAVVALLFFKYLHVGLVNSAR